MNNATKNAAAILIFVFILCFFLLYAVLFGYHNRSLRKERFTDPTPEQMAVPETAPLQEETENQGILKSLNNLLRSDSEMSNIELESRRRKEQRIQNRNERIQRRSDNYRDSWITLETSINIIGRSGMASRLAFIHTFKLLPALVIFLFVISFSVFFTFAPFQKESFQYHAIAVPSYFALVVFILLLIFAEFLFMPRLFKKTESMIHDSRVAHAALVEADRLYREEQLEKALEAVEIHLDLDSGSRDARLLQSAILEKTFQKTSTDNAKDVVERSGEDILTSYEKGQRAEREERYTIALYYYDRALAVQGERRDIREAYNRVQQKVDSMLATLSRDERVIRNYIEIKETALQNEEAGDYYAAYGQLRKLYRYETLRNNYPELYDDVELYYRDIQSALSQQDFLTDEIAPYEWLPSYDNIVFLEPREESIVLSGGKPILNSGDRIILWQDQYYFKGVDRLIDGRWGSFPYGKWVGNRIRVKTGNDYARVPANQVELFYIKSGLHPRYLIYANDNVRLTRQLDMYERFNLDTILSTFC